MNWYSYKAYDQEHHIYEEGMWADSEDEVRFKLRRKEWYLIGITEMHSVAAAHGHWRYKDCIEFSYRMSLLIESGLPMSSIMKFLMNSGGSIPYDILNEALQRGKLLSEALRDTGFPPIGCTLLQAGELSGTMGESFRIIHRYYEQEASWRHKLMSALAYPLFLAVLMIIFTGVAVGFILPAFRNVFASMQVHLPLLTRLLFAFGDWWRVYWWWALMLAAALGGLLIMAYRKPMMKLRLHQWWWQHIVCYERCHAFYLARLCRVWSMLLDSGLSITDVMVLTANLWNNRYATACQQQAIQAIQSGRGISTSLKESGLGSPLLWEMIEIGEETGEMVAMMSHCATYYQRIVTQVTASLERLMEPLMVTCMGIGVAILVIAVMLPMFQAVTMIHQ